MATVPPPKLGLALSGGGHRAAFFHVGVLAALAERGLLRAVQVISTVSGGSIVGALYYLHLKNLLETKADDDIDDADYVEVVRRVEADYRAGAARNVRASAYANLVANFRMARQSYSRTTRTAELYERYFYRGAWGDRERRHGRIAMRDLKIQPHAHTGEFVPDEGNPGRSAKVPVLLLESTTLNTGHNWRFEAMYMGEPTRQSESDAVNDIDKNVLLERTAWSKLPGKLKDFPLGDAVASSACFPGGFAPVQIQGLFDDLVVELVDGGVHDNQGVEGLLDRACTHIVLSDGSGQMPDVDRPATRIPAVLSRVVSIYGDAEREQRLLRALERDDSAFFHLQSGLEAYSRELPDGKPEPRPQKMTTRDFGVAEDAQEALARVRTDLDAFCETEAWSLARDAHAIAAYVIPRQLQIAALGTPIAPQTWPWTDTIDLQNPSPRLLKVLRVSKQRFGKPWLMGPAWLRWVVYGAAAVALALALAALGWLLVPHGAVLFGLGLGTLLALGLYAAPGNAVSRFLYDTAIPVLMAVPLFVVAHAMLLAGRAWLRLGRASRPG